MAKVTDFAEELSNRYGIKPEEASMFVNLMFDIINDELDSPDKQVKVKGLGTFKVTSVGARASVDVNTGERIILEGRNKISFTPEVLLRDRVNRPFVQFETVVLNDGVDFSDIDREFEESSKQDVAEESDEQAIEEENANVETEEESIDESDVAEQADADESVEPEPNVSVEPEQEEVLQESAEQTVSTELNVESEPHEDVVDEEENVEAKEENVKKEEDTVSAEEETVEAEDEKVEAEDEKVEAESNEDYITASADETVATDDNAETAESAVDTVSIDDEESEEEQESSNEKEVVAPRVNVGCKQRNPRLMYWLTTASFFLLVCIGIGMYFLYRQIEEKNKAIEQLQSRLNVHAATVDNKAEKSGDTVLPIAQPQKKQQENQQSSAAANPQHDNKVEATDKAVDKTKTEVADNSKAPNKADAASKSAADKKPVSKEAANKKTSAADKSSIAATAPSDYNYDVRIRTGAYIIVGTDRVVTVRQGQTLASISKANLGPGMECYVEVYNNRKHVKAGDKVKIPKLKLKKLR